MVVIFCTNPVDFFFSCCLTSVVSICFQGSGEIILKELDLPAHQRFWEIAHLPLP